MIDLDNLTEKEQLELVAESPSPLQDLKKPNIEFEMLQITRNWEILSCINTSNKKKQKEELKKLGFHDNLTEWQQIELVEKYPFIIYFLKKPSEIVQLKATLTNPFAIKYLKKPTEKVKFASIIGNPFTIKYLKKPAEKMQEIVVIQDWRTICYIDNSTKKIQDLAIRQNKEATYCIHDASKDNNYSTEGFEIKKLITPLGYFYYKKPCSKNKN